MPLTGTYLRTLDDKRRVAVPKRLRDDFGEANLEYLYVAPGTDRSLVVYGPQGFAQLSARWSGKETHQNYLRLFFASAERVDLDGQGRIRIPDRLADHAGLSRDAYLIGVQDHAELWDKAVWEAFSGALAADFDRLAREAYRS